LNGWDIVTAEKSTLQYAPLRARDVLMTAQKGWAERRLSASARPEQPHAWLLPRQFCRASRAAPIGFGSGV